jgi:polyhydroxyalkanoate synthesis repressor PhaR
MALIKRYANRKLYYSEEGRYDSLEDIAGMVRSGEEVRVLEHTSGRDITTLVLLQAVVAEERRLGEMLPGVVLTHLLQNGEETLGALRARMLAAFDPQRGFEEELRARMGRLVKRGDLPEQEGERLAHMRTRIEPEDENAPEEPPEPDLVALSKQVEDLERELQRLKNLPAA